MAQGVNSGISIEMKYQKFGHRKLTIEQELRRVSCAGGVSNNTGATEMKRVSGHEGSRRFRYGRVLVNVVRNKMVPISSKKNLVPVYTRLKGEVYSRQPEGGETIWMTWIRSE